MASEKFQETDNPILNEILQKYRDCSTDSISGPRGFGETVSTKPWMTAPDMKAKAIIVSSGESLKSARNSVLRSVTSRMFVPPKEQGTLKFKETLVNQIPLACFSYGGEKRLCFKDLVEKVLKGFTTQAINSARDQLHIHCPLCTPQQLEIFKLAGVLPWSCSSAGLINKTDAFRLIGLLTTSSFPRKTNRMFSIESLEVYHECFGGCVGTLEIEAYTDPYAECVACAQCDRVFSPRTFVTHTHSTGEIHTCHWGFDSAHWRLYLMLCNDHPTIHVQMMWEMLTSKFTDTSRRRCKREYRESGSDGDYHSNGRSRSPSFPGKRCRSENHDGRSSSSPQKPKEPEERFVYCSNGVVTSCSSNSADIMARRSAFRPWSPVGTKQNSRGINQSGIVSPGSPARIYGPSTITINTDLYSPSPAQCESSVGSNSPPGKAIEVHSKEPLCLEKTAKDMLEVVNHETHGWNAFEEAYSHLQHRPKHGILSTKTNMSEGEIYEMLLRHSRNGETNLKELSSILAKDLKDILNFKDESLKQLINEKNKMEEHFEATKREQTNRLDELYDELRKSKKDLRLCQARYRDETHELKNRINTLEAELRRQRLEKEGNNINTSKESLEVLQQEVRDMSVKLEQKDSFCRELENELTSLHSWIKNQAFHPASGFLYGYRPQRSDGRTVIQSVHLINGLNGNSQKTKTNGISKHHESSGDDS